VHDRCLLRIDPALTPDRLAIIADALHHVIAITIATAGSSSLNPTPEAAARFLGEIFEEQRVHRALEADMQFADLALG
jgi:hypothetical protein